MTKVAIVDKYNKGTNYSKFFPDVEVENFHLSSTNKKKLLKKDIDLEFDADAYDFVITVGAEATKHLCPKATVSSHQGYLVEEKFLPLIDPGMLIFKPDMKSHFEKACSNIIEYITGTRKVSAPRDTIGISNDEDEAHFALSEILELDPQAVALDTETDTLYARDGIVLGISIAAETHKGYYISSDIFSEECVSVLQQIVNKHTVVFHNAKFDIHMFEYHFGIDFGVDNVVDPTSFEDTMAMHYCLDESQGTHGLKDLAIKYTDLGDYDRELDDFKRTYCRQHKIKLGDFTYDLIPFEIMYKYAAIDAMATLELYHKFKKYLSTNDRLVSAYDLIKKGTKFLTKVEDNGVPFDKESLLVAQKDLGEQIYKLEEAIYQVPEVKRLEEAISVKFNPNSVVHLRYLFFKVLGLQPTGKKTATGADSVDAEVLTELATKHPIVQKIADIKKAKKIKSTYIDKVLVGLNSDGKLRTNFNLTTTTSGRLSSSGKLNMQQLPRDNKIVKSCIKAPEGYFIVSQDLATAEMYVAAVLSNDKNLKQVFINKQAGKGADFHSTVAHMVFKLKCDVTEVKDLYPGLRQAAKAISFGILYGSGPQKVADTVNADGDGSFTLDDALDAIKQYFNMFPQLKKWLTANQNYIKENGFIYSIFGRKRRLGNVFSSDKGTVGHEVRSGINFLVQSVASDINLLASINLQQYINDRKLDVEIFGLVHDSILAVVKKEDLAEYLDVAKRLTQADFGCSIPGCPIGIDQEIGTDYSFKEKYEMDGTEVALISD